MKLHCVDNSIRKKLKLYDIVVSCAFFGLCLTTFSRIFYLDFNIINFALLGFSFIAFIFFWKLRSLSLSKLLTNQNLEIKIDNEYVVLLRGTTEIMKFEVSSIKILKYDFWIISFETRFTLYSNNECFFLGKMKDNKSFLNDLKEAKIKVIENKKILWFEALSIPLLVASLVLYNNLVLSILSYCCVLFLYYLYITNHYVKISLISKEFSSFTKIWSLGVITSFLLTVLPCFPLTARDRELAYIVAIIDAIESEKQDNKIDTLNKALKSKISAFNQAYPNDNTIPKIERRAVESFQQQREIASKK